MTCPVMNDLIRHLAEEERREAREEAIDHTAMEIADVDAIDEMTSEERNKMAICLMAIIDGDGDGAEYARIDLRRLLWRVKRRMASEYIEREIAASQEDAAIDAWESRQERCDAWY